MPAGKAGKDQDDFELKPRYVLEVIETQFGLKENEVREIMRREMKSSSFKMWRERVSGRKTKHLSLRSKEVKRFKSKNQ